MANAYKTKIGAVTTSMASALSPAATSGMQQLVKECRITNITASPATVSVVIDQNSTQRHLAKDMVVPANSSLNVVDNVIALDENSVDSSEIHVQGSANSTLEYVISYLEIT